ncbi:MAG: cytosine permease [Pseudonocardiaceae bacterium]|nr:cytosine permease [Pseudonocardiaceae bacterium]
MRMTLQDSHITPTEERLQEIPDASRTTNVSGQFWIWAAVNLAPVNWILGGLGIALGLGLWDAFLVLAVGNVLGAGIFGVFVLIGQRTGVTAMVLSRAVFGRAGAYLPTAVHATVTIGWCAINTWVVLDLLVTLFGEVGFIDPSAENTALRIAIAAVLMALQLWIALGGFKVISIFERWTTPPTLAVLLLMTVTAWGFIGVDWSYSGAGLEGAARISAMSAVMTAIGFGWGVTFYAYAADYSRFVARTVPSKRLYFTAIMGQIIPVLWLGLLGATLAASHPGSDPGMLIVENYGVLAIPVLLLVIHGPLAKNSFNIYSFSVTAQALDIKLGRRALSIIAASVAMVIATLFVFFSEYASTITTWLSAAAVWVAAWAGTTLVYYFRIARGRVDTKALFVPVRHGATRSIDFTAFVSFFAGLVSGWLLMYGGLPAFKGPIAEALGGVDLSWLASGVVSALTYYILNIRSSTRVSAPDEDLKEQRRNR